MTTERRVFTKEFKEQAVRMAESSDKSAREVANDLGIGESTLWRWIKELRESGDRSFPGHGKRKQGTDQEEEIRRLKEVLLAVTMERDILKKAVAIFSKPRK